MPILVTEFEQTPNPNAVKVWVDQPLSDRPISFLSPDHAGDHPLATRLFAVPGITTVLINGDWLTVNKEQHASWRTVRQAVREALADL